MARPRRTTEQLGEKGGAEQRRCEQPAELARMLDRVEVACGFIATEPRFGAIVDGDEISEPPGQR